MGSSLARSNAQNAFYTEMSFMTLLHEEDEFTYDGRTAAERAPTSTTSFGSEGARLLVSVGV